MLLSTSTQRALGEMPGERKPSTIQPCSNGNHTVQTPSYHTQQPEITAKVNQGTREVKVGMIKPRKYPITELLIWLGLEELNCELSRICREKSE